MNTQPTIPGGMSEFASLVEQVSSDLGLKTELARAVVPVLLANLRILDRKQQDYGSTNLTKFGVFGVVVRMNDKLERAVNLVGRPPTADAPHNEPLSDTFLDLANYAAIAYVMQREIWPKQS